MSGIVVLEGLMSFKPITKTMSEDCLICKTRSFVSRSQEVVGKKTCNCKCPHLLKFSPTLRICELIVILATRETPMLDVRGVRTL